MQQRSLLTLRRRVDVLIAPGEGTNGVNGRGTRVCYVSIIRNNKGLNIASTKSLGRKEPTEIASTEGACEQGTTMHPILFLFSSLSFILFRIEAEIQGNTLIRDIPRY